MANRFGIMPTTEIRLARIVLWQDGKLLVQTDLRLPPDMRFWRLPGGRLELGEQPATAAIRESAEELGINVRIGELWYVGENTYTKKQHRVHEIVFYFAASVTPIPDSAVLSAEVHLHARLYAPSVLREERCLPQAVFDRVLEDGPSGPKGVTYIVESD